MKIWQYDNVVYIVHPPEPTGSEHGHVVAECRKLIDRVLKAHPRVAVYHDLTQSKSADNAYLQLWAEIGREYKDRGTYVTVVAQAWMRTLVKTVSFLGRFDIVVAKSPAEAAEKLAPLGYKLRVETAPV